MYRQVAQYTKYGNVKTNGFDSKAESSYAEELELRKKSGDIASYEKQVKVSLDVNGFHICNYIVDFLIHHNDGALEYVEVKGYETETYKIKKKLFEALVVDDAKGISYTVVKTLSKRSFKWGW